MILAKSLRRIPDPLLAETKSYLANMIALGGSISMGSLQSVDRFIRACKAAGVWNNLYMVAPIAGNNLAAALTYIPTGFSSAAATSVNFVETDYTEQGANGGIAGNGTTKYLDTNFLQSSVGATGHISAYLRETETANPKTWIGANTATDWCTLRSATGTQSQALFGLVQAVAPVDLTGGFYVNDRSAANRLDMYKNGVSVGNNTNNVVPAFAAINLFLLARNNNGAPAEWTTKRFSFFSIGASLTAAAHAAYYNAVQNLQTNLQRNV